ncbi:MAG: glycosyltransferase family 2 protein [Deltaproteobacteria bacterium]|nr:glycosyltransferase family 2 protein [Deltaproteobacteria bacterium]
MIDNKKIIVVIPAYRVAAQIENVVHGIPLFVDKTIVIDDKCPENSGVIVEELKLSNVTVIYHQNNQGVGGAVITGYRAAIADGADVIVKIDGDGQMDSSLIKLFVMPIMAGEADYAKGNRFFNLEKIRTMPIARLFGNAILSFITKLSSGYWDLFDPNNGYTAIHADIARLLPFDKISQRYFFETDMLFRLNTLRAVVVNIPMDAKYGDEVSNLKISKIFGEFFIKHMRNFLKRIFYNYYLRDMSLASIELPLGILLIISGSCYGVYHWIKSLNEGIITPPGTVMLAALPILMGLQLILAFLGYDIASVPRRPVHVSRHNAKK